MKPSFDAIASQIGLVYCRGITPAGHYCRRDHDGQGQVSEDGTVHFADRPKTRANIASFLKLCAIATDPSLKTDDLLWRSVYRRALLVQLAGAKIGMRFTDALSADRAFVLASVAGLSNDIPLRKRAYDWARRAPKGK